MARSVSSAALAIAGSIIGAVLVVLAPMPSPASLIDQQTKFHFLLSYPRCEVL